MPPDPFDLEIEKLSLPEAKQERLAREAAARKRAARGRAPDLDPTPLDERELISDDGIRIYGQPAGEDEIRPTLESTHLAWVRMGSPRRGRWPTGS